MPVRASGWRARRNLDKDRHAGSVVNSHASNLNQLRVAVLANLLTETGFCAVALLFSISNEKVQMAEVDMEGGDRA